MKDVPNVSIIIPVYKTEKYLEQCLESVVNQTLQNIEIIIIHDAPSLKETEIVQKFLKNDSRIKYIVNDLPVSLGKARNQGFEISTGEYFGCVDSDDWIELDMFEKLYNKAKLFNADVSFCCITTVSNDNEYTDYKILDENLLNYENKTFTFDDVSEGLFNLHVNAFNRIYKKEFYKDSKLKYPENIKFEDVVIYFEGLLKAQNICFVNECLYNYRVGRAGSIRNNPEGHYYAITTFLKELINLFKSVHSFEKYRYRLFDFYSQVYHWYTPNRQLFNFIKNSLKDSNFTKAEVKILSKTTRRILKYPFWFYILRFQRRK